MSSGPVAHNAAVARPINNNYAQDISVENHGSIVLIRLHTRAARKWVAENVPDDAQFFGGALVVEPRFLDDIRAGMLEYGLRG